MDADDVIRAAVARARARQWHAVECDTEGDAQPVGVILAAVVARLMARSSTGTVTTGNAHTFATENERRTESTGRMGRPAIGDERGGIHG